MRDIGVWLVESRDTNLLRVQRFEAMVSLSAPGGLYIGGCYSVRRVLIG